MASTELRRYLQGLATCIDNLDPRAVGQMLSLRDVHAMKLVQAMQYQDVAHFARSYFEGSDINLVLAHLNAALYVSQGKTKEAFDEQLLAVQAWREHIQAETIESNWSLHPLNTLITDLRLLAMELDEQLVAAGEKAVALEKAMEEINVCFRLLAGDRATDRRNSKKRGMIFLVNHLFAIAFKLNNFAFLKSLIRLMERQESSIYAMSHQVTYHYYMGRRSMYEANYMQANEHLSFAAQHCHRSSTSNKRLILLHLIPVNLLLGRLPTKDLLQTYNLMQFAQIVDAVKTGNLAVLNDELDKYQEFFVQWGVFLVLEKVKLLAYRNLFKRVWQIMNHTVIPLSSFLTAMQVAKEPDVDEDEVEGILANLIHQKMIKGYIAHGHRKLVLSKENPFPKLKSTAA
ncbi:uncharacterized protein MONBRDRAFT_36294 [Monosiga brevicollis MX1]|uniref:PCI domain-containing protein n=1 Tax=Monosiga brevicollis TaxID=81824 RepID=A9UUR3_MONBE|nr:uncharacterized protein MONBRDRAFT_36294 [Monosiga brevicollis MX1]EDQ90949.1 predicted protein [Monosiga brevicollis MX1]|eukprot:XP_001744246.1 hypothetical protein [Monosiga brevicollis MX1]